MFEAQRAHQIERETFRSRGQRRSMCTFSIYFAQDEVRPGNSTGSGARTHPLSGRDAQIQQTLPGMLQQHRVSNCCDEASCADLCRHMEDGDTLSWLSQRADRGAVASGAKTPGGTCIVQGRAPPSPPPVANSYLKRLLRFVSARRRTLEPLLRCVVLFHAGPIPHLGGFGLSEASMSECGAMSRLCQGYVKAMSLHISTFIYTYTH